MRRQGRSCRPVYRAYRAVRYVARCASNEGGDFRADSADSGGRGCRVRNPIHQQAIPAVGCICVLARSRGSADFRTSDQLRSLGISRRWAICCPAGCRSVAWARPASAPTTAKQASSPSATSKPWLPSRSSPTLCASCTRPSMKPGQTVRHHRPNSASVISLAVIGDGVVIVTFAVPVITSID